MTAEIALLNKTAIALAADSAMTLQGTGKIYAGNKLFALSKYHPVGVMIYNNTEFMGVPLETIIKMYRRSVGTEPRQSTEVYVEDFLQYLQHPPVQTEEQELVNLLRIASDTYAQLYDDVRLILGDRRHTSTRDAGRAIRKAVQERLEDLEESSDLESMKAVDAERVVAAHRTSLDGCIDGEFPGFSISQATRKLLLRLFRRAIKSEDLSTGHSGIVIAGFGEGEMFPKLFEVRTDGFVAGELKYQVRERASIGRTGDFATIIPFAQGEMVHRFMQGVDPEFLDYLRPSIEELLYQFGKSVLDAHKLTDDRRLTSLRDVASKLADDYFTGVAWNFQRERFVDPIMEVVTHLPKEELAGMAEALVNLTSLKRRVSLDQETVAGPIDIAVISKGDGFVWIKRKHYFDPALNTDYFSRQSLVPREGHSNEQ